MTHRLRGQGDLKLGGRSRRGRQRRAGEPTCDDITSYSFRDLYISELLMIAVERFKVAKMAGTNHEEVDRTYRHFFNDDLAEAQQRLAVSRRGRF